MALGYQTYVAGKKVIVISRYAGKTVKGVAKCNPNDVFDPQIGEKLAKLRCDEKIAKKRVKRAEIVLKEVTEAVEKAKKQLADATQYNCDAHKTLLLIQAQLKQLELDTL